MDHTLLPWDVVFLVIAELPFAELRRVWNVSKRWFEACKARVGPLVPVVGIRVLQGECNIIFKKKEDGVLELSFHCWCSPRGMDR